MGQGNSEDGLELMESKYEWKDTYTYWKINLAIILE